MRTANYYGRMVTTETGVDAERGARRALEIFHSFADGGAAGCDRAECRAADAASRMAEALEAGAAARGEGHRPIHVAVLDPTHGHALLEIDWTALDPKGDGPLRARAEIFRYDADGLVWLGVAYGLPVMANVRDGLLVVGGQSFRAQLAALEQFIS